MSRLLYTQRPLLYFRVFNSSLKFNLNTRVFGIFLVYGPMYVYACVYNYMYIVGIQYKFVYSNTLA